MTLPAVVVLSELENRFVMTAYTDDVLGKRATATATGANGAVTTTSYTQRTCF